MRLTFNLKRLRLQKGLSQKEAGDEAGVSQGTWSRAERGLNIEPEQARSIAKWVGADKTPGDLWDFDDEQVAA